MRGPRLVGGLAVALCAAVCLWACTCCGKLPKRTLQMARARSTCSGPIALLVCFFLRPASSLACPERPEPLARPS